ncbi:FRG domain-containing protein [Patulibacter americanus]|uniref:FRG domain-containing protein n=1 Tax=Patulibacter americanus TaxID=588672 RepID=UPI0003B50228|nr:FRG domain-containing protein [Patulibacter americanus]
MSLPDGFYAPWESEIDGFEKINDLLTRLSERWLVTDRLFAWRGVSDATFPLHSSLYRRLLWQREASGNPEPPDEAALAEAEGKLLAETHRWGLHNGPQGRLSILYQLAALQHFGAPTRLIDVTLNAYIGLWFAVEKDDGRDGRLFAVDITSKLINEQSELRDWEDRRERPWAELPEARWTGETFAWKPPPFERRIAAQNGAFLFAGVPKTAPGFQLQKQPGGSKTWPRADVRRGTSLPLRLHKADPKAGGVGAGGAPAYTFRIVSAAKPAIRKRLEGLFGYTHQTIYPDLPGFAQYGTDLPAAPSA